MTDDTVEKHKATELIEAAEQAPEDKKGEAYNDALAFFLADDNSVRANPPEEDVIIKRGPDADTQVPIATVRIRALTEDDFKLVRKRATARSKRNGEKEGFSGSFFGAALAAKAIIAPDLAKAISGTKYTSIEDWLQDKFLSAELELLGERVGLLSGYGSTVDAAGRTVDEAEIEAAKN